jgi:hypothetical protein
MEKYFENELKDHRLARRLPRGGVRGGRGVLDAVVDLVADQPHAVLLAPASRARRARTGAASCRSGCRAGDDQALHRLVELLEHADGRLEAGLGTGRQLDDLAASAVSTLR